MLGFAGPAVIEVSGAAVSIVHVRLAGVGSVFPAASVAFTWKVWLPTARPVYAFGLVQPANAAPSRLHWKVEPDSLEEKLKLGLVELLGFAGLDVIVVSGGVVSIVHVYVAATPTFPIASVARTANVWLPAASPE